jgi:hypothetical protein
VPIRCYLSTRPHPVTALWGERTMHTLLMTSGKSVGTPHQRHRSGQHFYSTRVESSRMFNTISGFGGHSPSAGTPAASPDGSMEVHRRNEQAPRRRVTHGKQRHHLIPPPAAVSFGRGDITSGAAAAQLQPAVPDGDSWSAWGPTPTSPGQDEAVRADLGQQARTRHR